MIQILLVGAENVLQVDDLFDQLGEIYVPDATITVDVLDDHGAVVDGATGLAMAPVGGSRASYRALIPAAAALVRNRRYTAQLTITKDGLSSPLALGELLAE